ARAQGRRVAMTRRPVCWRRSGRHPGVCVGHAAVLYDFLDRRKCFSRCSFFFSSRRRHTRSVSAFLLNRSSDLSIMENTNLSKQQQVSEIMRQMLTQAQTAGQYFTNDQIKEMTRKVSAEVDLVHQQTQNQRYGSSHI